MNIIKNLSVRNKILVFLGAFLLLASANFITIVRFNAVQEKKDVSIKTLIEQRTIAQSAALYSNRLASGDLQVKLALQAAIQDVTAFLQSLRTGHSEDTLDHESTFEYPQEAMLVVEKTFEKWNTYASLTKSLLAEADSDQALKSINQAFPGMIKQFDQLIDTYRTNKESSKQAFIVTITVITSATLLVAWVMLGLLKRYIQKPIAEIKSYAENLSVGALTATRSYDSVDELGKSIDALDILKKRLSEASEFATKVGSGDYNAEYEALETDNLGLSLIDMRRKLAVAKDQDQKRRWTNEGLAKFGEILRNDKDNLEELSIAIISDLVKYVGANQGSLFLINDDDRDDVFLTLTGCYAWNRRKFLEKKIRPGEGLIGQAWLEETPIYMKEIPEDYIHIKSGLGEALPTSIYIIPLKTESKIEGMVELAFFQELEDYKKDFLQKLSENIASTVSATRVAERTKVLLEQSQQHAEEMRAQEEEMRQNMEELQATQEELARQTRETQQFNKAVNSSSIIVEFSNDGKFLNVNEQFEEITGYTKDEVVGKDHSFYVPQHLLKDGSFKELWEKLSKGQHFVKDVERIKKNGEHFWLRVSYMPVFDIEGRLQNILCICFDVTKEILAEKETEKFMNAVDNSSIIIDFNSDGHIVHINKKFMEVTGYTREEMIGQPHTYYVPESGIKSGAFEQLWEDLAQGKHFVRDVERVKKNGEHFWLRASYMPMFNEHGELERISCICFDVTQEILREKEARKFNDAVNNSSIIIDFNKDGKIVHINKKFKEVTGYTEQEMIGQPHTYYVPESRIKSGVFEKLWEDLAKGEHFVRDVERVKKNGEHFWLRASYMPIFDEVGQLERISCICFDITAEKVAQDQS